MIPRVETVGAPRHDLARQKQRGARLKAAESSVPAFANAGIAIPGGVRSHFDAFMHDGQLLWRAVGVVLSEDHGRVGPSQ